MVPNDSDADEVVWCASQRAVVLDYLKREGLAHGEVGDWPAWHVWPYVAVWAVESLKSPGRVGWWAISGDLPTDYTPCGPAPHPREGVKDIAERWRDGAYRWGKGESAEGWVIGSPDEQKELAPLLAARANLLLSWVADPRLWEE
ncbi:DUF4826 family protein [Sinorhizobium fredii]|uniref:DUF4826 family protein n=1 Tax=Rhizobium fredii TaxID=380 RepID=UPI0012FDACB6